MRIRYLSDNRKELNQVAEWIFSEWASSNPDNSIEKIAKLYANRCNSTKIPLTIVAMKSEVFGTASLVESEMTTHPELTPWLSSLYVRADQRGRGIGALLCTRVLEEAKRLGYKKCYLCTDQSEEFYLKRGWKVLAREQRKTSEVVVMEFKLSK